MGDFKISGAASSTVMGGFAGFIMSGPLGSNKGSAIQARGIAASSLAAYAVTTQTGSAAAGYATGIAGGVAAGAGAALACGIKDKVGLGLFGVMGGILGGLGGAVAVVNAEN